MLSGFDFEQYVTLQSSGQTKTGNLSEMAQANSDKTDTRERESVNTMK